MKYDALEIAKYVLSYCFNSGSPISNLRLQKMLYFIQGEFYKVKGEELFDNEICAWQFGPVIPEVYYEYCVYAGTPIVGNYSTRVMEEDASIINSIINGFSDVPTWRLVEMTHEVGTPWYNVFYSNGNRSPIPAELIREHFTKVN